MRRKRIKATLKKRRSRAAITVRSRHTRRTRPAITTSDRRRGVASRCSERIMLALPDDHHPSGQEPGERFAIDDPHHAEQPFEG